MELNNVKVMSPEQLSVLEELIQQGVVNITVPIMDETTAEALKMLLEDLVDLIGNKSVTLSAQNEHVIVSLSVKAKAATTTTTTTPATTTITLNPSVIKKLPDGYVSLDKVDKKKRRLSPALYVGNEKHGFWELYLADAELGIVQDGNGHRATLRDAVRQWIKVANLNLTTFNQFQYTYAHASDQLP